MTCPLRVNVDEILARLEHLSGLLQQDSLRANAVFRQIFEPITMSPVEQDGKHFYRATGTARGAEMLDRLGVAQALDFGGCGGLIYHVYHRVGRGEAPFRHAREPEAFLGLMREVVRRDGLTVYAWFLMPKTGARYVLC